MVPVCACVRACVHVCVCTCIFMDIYMPDHADRRMNAIRTHANECRDLYMYSHPCHAYVFYICTHKYAPVTFPSIDKHSCLEPMPRRQPLPHLCVCVRVRVRVCVCVCVRARACITSLRSFASTSDVIAGKVRPTRETEGREEGREGGTACHTSVSSS